MTGWKDWQIGEVVTESDFQSFVQDQVVQRYADASARTSALGTAVAEGMVSYLEDTNKVEVYDGSSWVQVGQEGDITSVTAGTGLTGGGTAGDVTLNADYAAIGSAVSITASQVTDLTASAAAINTIDDGTAGYTALSNGTAGITYQPVSHNYIINGAFDVWQRGTSFSAANVYTADRWTKNYATAFTTETISQQAFTAGELEVAGSGEYPFYLRQSITSVGSSTRSSIIQHIEDVRTLAGQQVTLSFYAKADSSRTLAGLFLIQDFGSGGSADVATTLSGTTIALTTSWQRFTKTVTLPSVSGKTIGTSSSLYVRFDMALADGSVLDLWGVQLEAGSVATPFKRHAPSLQGELAACQRYYWRAGYNSAYGGQLYNYPFLGTGVATTSSNVQVVMPIPVPMRLAPTSLDLLAASSYVLTDGASSFTASSISIDIYGLTGYNSVCFNVGGSGLTAGKTYFLRSQFGSNAYIGVNGGEL